MSIDLFRLSTETKQLQRIPPLSMSELGFGESYDLEAWLASCPERLFGRNILWIARQERASVEQRSDIIGVDREGNLLITELKKGELEESAVTQALSYAAEYSEKYKFVADLTNVYAEQSKKVGSTGLILRADSEEDASKKLLDHMGPETEMSGTQILILLGEHFSTKALAICDYLIQYL
jgi:RecB family endonuclease NucS